MLNIYSRNIKKQFSRYFKAAYCIGIDEPPSMTAEHYIVWRIDTSSLYKTSSYDYRFRLSEEILKRFKAFCKENRLTKSLDTCIEWGEDSNVFNERIDV